MPSIKNPITLALVVFAMVSLGNCHCEGARHHPEEMTVKQQCAELISTVNNFEAKKQKAREQANGLEVALAQQKEELKNLNAYLKVLPPCSKNQILPHAKQTEDMSLCELQEYLTSKISEIQDAILAASHLHSITDVQI